MICKYKVFLEKHSIDDREFAEKKEVIISSTGSGRDVAEWAVDMEEDKETNNRMYWVWTAFAVIA
jgi:hypothetical protein